MGLAPLSVPGHPSLTSCAPLAPVLRPHLLGSPGLGHPGLGCQSPLAGSQGSPVCRSALTPLGGGGVPGPSFHTGPCLTPSPWPSEISLVPYLLYENASTNLNKCRYRDVDSSKAAIGMSFKRESHGFYRSAAGTATPP